MVISKYEDLPTEERKYQPVWKNILFEKAKMHSLSSEKLVPSNVEYSNPAMLYKQESDDIIQISENAQQLLSTSCTLSQPKLLDISLNTITSQKISGNTTGKLNSTVMDMVNKQGQETNHLNNLDDIKNVSEIDNAVFPSGYLYTRRIPQMSQTQLIRSDKQEPLRLDIGRNSNGNSNGNNNAMLNFQESIMADWMASPDAEIKTLEELLNQNSQNGRETRSRSRYDSDTFLDKSLIFDSESLIGSRAGSPMSEISGDYSIDDDEDDVWEIINSNIMSMRNESSLSSNDDTTGSGVLSSISSNENTQLAGQFCSQGTDMDYIWNNFQLHNNDIFEINKKLTFNNFTDENDNVFQQSESTATQTDLSWNPHDFDVQDQRTLFRTTINSSVQPPVQTDEVRKVLCIDRGTGTISNDYPPKPVPGAKRKVKRKSTGSKRSYKPQVRRERPNKCYHLWDFLRDLLTDKNNNWENMIEWIDSDRDEFKINNTKSLADEWGNRKNIANMTYDKLSRTIRYYLKLGILHKVNNRRLQFQFGQKGKMWTRM